MKGLVSASMIIFANFAFAAQLKLNCEPQGIEAMPDGKSPMVLHITLGSEVTDKLETKDLDLSALSSGTTMAMEINFATHIGGPGQSRDIPVPVSAKDQNLMVGDESGNALLPMSSLKSALAGSIENFEINFVEKKQSMPFDCSVKK